MRGRYPSGVECVDPLAGSAQAKERLKVVLDTLAGRLRVQQACRQLGISEPRFRQLRQQALTAALAGLEPKSIGRPPRVVSPEAERLAALEEERARQEVALRMAQVREEVALILPRVVQEPPPPEKKTRRRRQSRPTGRRKRT